MNDATIDLRDIDVLIGAATLRGEAGGEGVDENLDGVLSDAERQSGMVHVAWVLRHRIEREGFPDSLTGVCLYPWAFSFWNGDSRRRAPLLEDDRSERALTAMLVLSTVFSAAAADDPTDGADHYFNPDLAAPSWAPTMLVTVRHGHHVFLDSTRVPGLADPDSAKGAI